MKVITDLLEDPITLARWHPKGRGQLFEEIVDHAGLAWRTASTADENRLQSARPLARAVWPRRESR